VRKLRGGKTCVEIKTRRETKEPWEVGKVRKAARGKGHKGCKQGKVETIEKNEMK
jgi:hypothetical protein